MPAGGARPNSGPKKGSVYAKTRARREAQRRYLKREGLTAERVLEELRRLAFSDIRALFDKKGNLRPLGELTDEQAAALASVEVVHRNLTAGDDVTDTIHKLRQWDKTKALEMLAKHFKLLTEIVQHEGLERVAERLADARKQHARSG